MDNLNIFEGGLSTFLAVFQLIVFLVSIVIFVIYSRWALKHLEKYGYVGDKCQTVSKIYTTIAFVVIILALILYFI